jgi:methane monooxygenase PmoA-like
LDFCRFFKAGLYDLGARPFILAARVADTRRIRDHGTSRLPDGSFPLLEPPGQIENSAGQRGEEQANGQHACWCDYAGKVGAGWNGIALFDHPDNDEFPGQFHAGNYGCLSITHHYPPYVPPTSSVTWTARVYVHADDVRKGKVAQKYQDFIDPPKVTVT